MPGWVQDSWGYHGDDGNSFACQTNGKPYSPVPYGPTFSTNDIIGCAINFRNGTAFYTKNGISLGVAFKDVKGSALYPTVGMRTVGEHIRVNFGQRPFMFDIDAFMREEKIKTYKQISSYPLSIELLNGGLSSAPPNGPGASASDAALTHTIHKLIASYLGYNGYVDSVHAFADDVQKEILAFSNARVDNGNNANSYSEQDMHEDLETVNRQKIRVAVLEGNIDRALKLTELFFPKAFEDNPEIVFQLKCRKFVELMRSCALAKEGDEWTVSDQIGEYSEDQEMSDFSAAESEKPVPNSSDQLLNEALRYGQKLHDDYKSVTFTPKTTQISTKPATTSNMSSSASSIASDSSSSTVPSPQITASPTTTFVPDVQKALGDIFSLMAYPDPLQSPVAHLLSEDGRAAVAEDLNAAILVSEGKLSIAPLERLIKHTTVLIRELAEQGGQAAFVNIRRDFLSS